MYRLMQSMTTDQPRPPMERCRNLNGDTVARADTNAESTKTTATSSKNMLFIAGSTALPFAGVARQHQP
jgi:hypothetical protein